MALRVKVLGAKTDNLSSIPGGHKVERNNRPKSCPLTSTLWDVHVYEQWETKGSKCKQKFKTH